MAYWEVPGDLDYDPDTAMEPEVNAYSDPDMRGTWEVHILLPRCRPLLLTTHAKGWIVVERLEVDKSRTVVFDSRGGV